MHCIALLRLRIQLQLWKVESLEILQYASWGDACPTSAMSKFHFYATNLRSPLSTMPCDDFEKFSSFQKPKKKINSNYRQSSRISSLTNNFSVFSNICTITAVDPDSKEKLEIQISFATLVTEQMKAMVRRKKNIWESNDVERRKIWTLFGKKIGGSIVDWGTRLKPSGQRKKTGTNFWKVSTSIVRMKLWVFELVRWGTTRCTINKLYN